MESVSFCSQNQMKICLNSSLIIGIFLLILSCSSQPDKNIEVKRGRLKYIKTLSFGRVGTHGSKDWYVSGRELKINDRNFEPRDIKIKEDIADCEGSPNELIEALKCYSFKDSKASVYVLRIKDDKPIWETAYEGEYIESSGKNLGEWINDGKTLIFKDHFFDVQTGDKQKIKGLPDFPEEYFRAVSPDLETIIYQGICFSSVVKIAEDVIITRNKVCQKEADYKQKKLTLLWLINSKTGETKFLPLSWEKNDWVFWNDDKFRTKPDWLKFFQQQLVWEKDKEGKYQLVYPK